MPIYCSCIRCKTKQTTANINKHYPVCTGSPKIEKLHSCKYCDLVFGDMSTSLRRNHLRWCENNPKSKKYRDDLRSGNTGNLGARMREKSASKESRAKASKGISQAHKDGKYIGAPEKSIQTKIINGTLCHTEEAKAKMSVINRGLTHQRVCRQTHEFVDKRGRVFKFDSSREDALAIRLDELDIYWTRPSPIKYVDLTGKERNYFPDFYIPDLDLYLDPKNPWVEQTQKEKLDIVSHLISLEIIGSLDECKNWIPPNIRQ